MLSAFLNASKKSSKEREELQESAAWFLRAMERSEKWPTAVLLMHPDTKPAFDAWLRNNLTRNIQELTADNSSYTGLYQCAQFYAPSFRNKDCALQFLSELKLMLDPRDLEADIHEALFEVQKGRRKRKEKIAAPTVPSLSGD